MAAFPETRWSLLVRAQDGSVTISHEALGEVLTLYSPALKAHLIHRRGLQPHDAEDLLQDFIAQKILERELLKSADRNKGKFRSLLLRSLTNFVIDESRRRRTHGQALQLNEDLDAKQVADCDVLDVMWARQVLLEALNRMRHHCLGSGQEAIWSVFVLRVLQPAVSGEEASYEEVVRRCGLKDAAQASNRLMTAKRQFTRILDVVISEYAEGSDSIEDEKKHFQYVLANSRVLHAKEFAELTGDVTANASRELTSIMKADPEQLSLVIDYSDRQFWTEDDLAAFLTVQLETPLSSVVTSGDDVVDIRVGDLLKSSNPQLPWLVELQQFSQGLVHGGGTESPQEVGALLYFAAIASALVRHRKQISESPAGTLATGMHAFASRSWVPAYLQGLLREASELLTQK